MYTSNDNDDTLPPIDLDELRARAAQNALQQVTPAISPDQQDDTRTAINQAAPKFSDDALPPINIDPDQSQTRAEIKQASPAFSLPANEAMPPSAQSQLPPAASPMTSLPAQSLDVPPINMQPSVPQGQDRETEAAPDHPLSVSDFAPVGINNGGLTGQKHVRDTSGALPPISLDNNNLDPMAIARRENPQVHRSKLQILGDMAKGALISTLTAQHEPGAAPSLGAALGGGIIGGLGVPREAARQQKIAQRANEIAGQRQAERQAANDRVEQQLKQAQMAKDLGDTAHTNNMDAIELLKLQNEAAKGNQEAANKLLALHAKTRTPLPQAPWVELTGHKPGDVLSYPDKQYKPTYAKVTTVGPDGKPVTQFVDQAKMANDGTQLPVFQKPQNQQAKHFNDAVEIYRGLHPEVAGKQNQAWVDRASEISKNLQAYGDLEKAGRGKTSGAKAEDYRNNKALLDKRVREILADEKRTSDWDPTEDANAMAEIAQIMNGNVPAAKSSAPVNQQAAAPSTAPANTNQRTATPATTDQGSNNAKVEQARAELQRRQAMLNDPNLPADKRAALQNDIAKLKTVLGGK